MTADQLTPLSIKRLKRLLFGPGADRRTAPAASASSQGETEASGEAQSSQAPVEAA